MGLQHKVVTVDPAARDVGKPTAIVVEPDRLTRWSVRLYLEQWYDVVAVATVADALAALESLGPTSLRLLVVADPMPDGTADALITRARELGPDATIVRTVVPPSTSDGAVAPEAGVKVIEKPFLLDALGSALAPP